MDTQQDTPINSGPVPTGAPPATRGRGRTAGARASSTAAATTIKAPGVRGQKRQAASAPAVTQTVATGSEATAAGPAPRIPASSRAVMQSLEAEYERGRMLGERLISMNRRFNPSLPAGQAEEIALQQLSRHHDKLESSISTLSLAD